MPQPKRIAILGSTGSIGTQALDVISQHPDRFRATVLTAGRNADLLISQARAFLPDTVVIADETRYDRVREALADLPVKVFTGAESLAQAVTGSEVDVVLTAVVGFAGLVPTVAAIKAGKTIALANKETLVVAGGIIRELCARYQVDLLPVDSEHSAIFQSLLGQDTGPDGSGLRRILLTASGGPFRHMSADEIARVTPEQALRHPSWHMGAKITIDSATMLNKGFEMIEACWLFGATPAGVEVVVHPESVIHSAVELADGAVIAQLGVPDMRLPIQFALSFPERLPLSGERLDLFALGALHFERPDLDRFPCLRLAYEAMETGATMPCVLNGANEVFNAAFRHHRIGFTDIARGIERVMHEMPPIAYPSLDDLIETDREARERAEELVELFRS